MAYDRRLPDRGPALCVAACMLLFAGCGGEAGADSARAPLRMEDLVVSVSGGPRSYFLSDRRGGFVTGTLSPGGAWNLCSWTVHGSPVVERVRVTPVPTGEQGDLLDSAAVRPDRVTGFRRDGLALTIEPVELQEATVRAVLIRVTRARPGPVGLEVAPAVDYRPVDPGAEGAPRWRRASPPAELMLIPARDAGWLLVHSAGPLPEATRTAIVARVLEHSAERSARLERLLERTHLRLSDPVLTRAVAWMKLSIDALVCVGAETLAVAGLPWEGTFSGRENARALAMLGLATGDYAVARGVTRTLAAHQDTVASRATFGRIPDRIGPAGAEYGGADVSPWFVREAYEYITRSNDVALAAQIYPAVKRSIEGAARRNTNRENLFVHRPAEVAMSVGRFRASEGSTVAAVELQLLWFFQQLIGSFLADYVGDRSAAVRWQRGSKQTEGAFDRAFVDSAHDLLYDHLGSGGRGVAVVRPNGLFALEILGSERVQQSMIRIVAGSLLYPHGPGTLGAAEPGFTPFVGGGPGGLRPAADGPVLTSLISQATYALTRYDRQDLSALMIRTLAERSLSHGMIGTLPEMIDVLPPEGESLPRDGGRLASLTGMSEFLRSVYSDHLGIHLDAPSGLIRTEPKLPADISSVEFTVALGDHAVHGTYRRTEEGGRMTLRAPDLPAPVRWGFAWVEQNGDAWRGSVMLPPGREITLVFGPEQMGAYDGTSEVPCEGCNHIRGFSRRDDIGGLTLAVPGR